MPIPTEPIGSIPRPLALDPRLETAEEVRDRVLEAARYIPLAQLGTTGAAPGAAR